MPSRSGFPEHAAIFYGTGPAHTAARLRGVLQDPMDRGELRPVDSDFAASTLLSMLVGPNAGRFLLSGEPPPEPDPTRSRNSSIATCALLHPRLPLPIPVPQRSVP